MAFAILAINLFKMNKTIELPTIDDFIIVTLASFAMMSVVVHLFRPKEKEFVLPDDYYEIFNERKQLVKKGMFERGKQLSGIKHVYKKDGTLSHTEKCINGVYTQDTPTTKKSNSITTKIYSLITNGSFI